MNALNEKRLYQFAEVETRLARAEQMERQLRATQPFTPQRQSDPNLYKD